MGCHRLLHRGGFSLPVGAPMSSKIEWLAGPDGSQGEVWNPVVGCSRVSAGCDHCYAMGVAHRAMQSAHAGLTKLRPKDASRPGVDWTGEVRCLPERLSVPIGWRKPRRVFVNSMSDLFHPAVPFTFVAAVFGVMAACPQHTFLVLTKRPERALEFFEWLSKAADWNRETPLGWCLAHAANHLAGEQWSRAVEKAGFEADLGDDPWPLHGVHLGVSAEDQPTWDERVPLLLQCPAAVHWVSVEPQLGFIDTCYGTDARERDIDCREGPWSQVPFGARLGWLVVGGESGPGARPFKVEWARSIISQCIGDQVPVFFKQGGSLMACPHDSKGGCLNCFPPDLRVRQYPEVARG
jgi:protein gp37